MTSVALWAAGTHTGTVPIASMPTDSRAWPVWRKSAGNSNALAAAIPEEQLHWSL